MSMIEAFDALAAADAAEIEQLKNDLRAAEEKYLELSNRLAGHYLGDAKAAAFCAGVTA